MGKHERPGSVPPVESRDDVRVQHNRCPYCHDDVRAADEDVRVCAACLARHHKPCWSELRRCSACGAQRCLRRRARLGRSRRATGLRTLGVGAGVVVLILCLATTYHALSTQRRSARRAALQLEAERTARARVSKQGQVQRDADAHLRREAILTRLAMRDRAGLTDLEIERSWREEKRLAAEERRKEEARQAFRKRVNKLMRQAKRLFEGKLYPAALEVYAKVLELEPKNVEALHAQAVIHARTKRYRTAIADCERALSIEPNLVKAIVTRGNARYRHGDVKGALADFELALKKDPTHVAARHNRGVVRAKLGDAEAGTADKQAAGLLEGDGLTELVVDRADGKAGKAVIEYGGNSCTLSPKKKAKALLKKATTKR